MVLVTVMLASTAACLGDLEPQPGGNTKPDAGTNPPPPDGGGQQTQTARQLFDSTVVKHLAVCQGCHSGSIQPTFVAAKEADRYATLTGAGAAVLANFDATKAPILKYKHSPAGPQTLWDATKADDITKWLAQEAKEHQ